MPSSIINFVAIGNPKSTQFNVTGLFLDILFYIQRDSTLRLLRTVLYKKNWFLMYRVGQKKPDSFWKFVTPVYVDIE